MNASTCTRATDRPHNDAATSSSRTARKDRPTRLRLTLARNQRTSTAAMQQMIDCQRFGFTPLGGSGGVTKRPPPPPGGVDNLSDDPHQGKAVGGARGAPA